MLKIAVEVAPGVFSHRKVHGFPGREYLDRGKIKPKECENLKKLVQKVPEARVVAEILLSKQVVRELMGEAT